MKLEQQVTSLELSKKLKELEVKQESLWYHIEWKIISSITSPIAHRTTRDSYKQLQEADYSAFTVAELGEMLPANRIGKKSNWECESWMTETEQPVKIWEFSYGESGERSDFLVNENTEANARAKALIWFIENDHIKV